MIVVKRIVGESYDLTNGEQIPKALVLSNGTREVFVPVDDETALAVVRLMVGDPAIEEEVVVPAPAPERVPDFSEETPDPAPMFETPLRVAPEPESEQGETVEYDDPESGVASI